MHGFVTACHVCNDVQEGLWNARKASGMIHMQEFGKGVGPSGAAKIRKEKLNSVTVHDTPKMICPGAGNDV